MNEVLTLIENVAAAPEGTGGVILFFVVFFIATMLRPRLMLKIVWWTFIAVVVFAIGALLGRKIGRGLV